MTTAALVTLFFGVVIIMTALQLSKGKERKTTNHKSERPPLAWWNVSIESWPGTRFLAEMMQNLGRDVYQLKQQIGREARADERRDTKMSAETQAAIDELKAEVGPMSDAVTAVAATVDKLLAMIEEAGDDPDEIRAVVANFRSERDRIIAAALKGTPIDPSAE